MPKALSESQASAYLGLPRATLVKMRRGGIGPSYIRIETTGEPAICYMVDDLDDFLLSRRIVVPQVIGARTHSVDPNRPIF